MVYDLKKYAEAISVNAGLNYSLYSIDKKLVFGENVVFNFPKEAVQGVFLDTDNGVTYFVFKLIAEDYVGVVLGVDKTSQTYARLLLGLFESFTAKNEVLTKEEFYKALILGELSQAQIKKYLAKFFLKNGKCCILNVNCSSKANEILEISTAYSAEDVCFAVILDNNVVSIVKYVDDDGCEYKSSSEFAYFLSHLIYEELGVKVCIDIGGVVDSLGKINKSFLQAEEVARMRGAQVNVGVHSYKQYVLLTLLEELPVTKLNELYNLLTDLNENQVYNDKELTKTAEEFLECSLNLSETARKLYLHRNTLIYRLDKLENETGLNVRNFNDALTFRLIMLLKKLLG